VLFCDLVGSTSVGDRLDPEALRSVMAAYHAEMRDAVERHGGTVAKFIGDAVMAVFGLPELHEDDAFRAVRAADEMRGSLVGLGSELAESRDVRMACRIGVNTGVVVVGSGEEIITGDAVNIAARLEQAAHDNHVVLGEETERLVRGAVETSPIVVDAKGKAEPLSAHVLVSVAPDADPLGRRADTRMVGREDELALLLAMYRRTVRVGKCHQVTVLGPAGIGKSRLVREMTAGFPEALIVSGRCLPYGEGITYWPILEAFVEAFGDDPIAEIARLTAGDPDGERVTQSVAVALGLADGIGGEGIPWAVRRVLETLAERRPLVVVLDDMHSAESALHELIDHVASFARPVPLLLVCMARPAGMGGDLAMAYADIARCHLSGSTDPDRDLEELHARAMAATRLFSQRGDDRGLSIAWLAIAEFHAVAGRNAASHRAQLEALAAARRAGDRSQEVRISAEIPIKVWFGPTPANDVVAQVDELLAAADTVDPVRAEALIVRGVARAAGGDIAAGREDVARGRSMRAELGQLVNWAVTAQLAARVEILAGDRVRAEVLLREGSSELARLGETGYLSTNEGQRALILIDLDRLPDATDATRVCRRTAARDDVASQALWRSAEALLRSHDAASFLERPPPEMDAGATIWRVSIPSLTTLSATRRRTGSSCSAMKTRPNPPSPMSWRIL